MDLVTAAHAVASVLLVVSGSYKVTDPGPPVRFLVDLGIPLGDGSLNSRSRPSNGRIFGQSVGRLIGRLIGVFEIVTGLAALLIGGAITAGLVAVVYLAFAVFVVLAILRGVDNCGCFGHSDSPPNALHVLIDLALAAASLAAITADTPMSVLDTDGSGAVVFVVGVGVATGLIRAALDGSLSPAQRR